MLVTFWWDFLDLLSSHSPSRCSSNERSRRILFDIYSNLCCYSVCSNLIVLVQLVKRHAAEILSSVILSTVFSLYSTAFIGRLVGLEPSLTISVLPRCITVALALSIVSFFEGTNLGFLHYLTYGLVRYRWLTRHVWFVIRFRCQSIPYSSCGCSDWPSWCKFRSDGAR